MTQNSREGLPPWQLAIIDDYPEIYLRPNPECVARYQELQRPVPVDFCSLRYGFECHQGWEALIRKISHISDSLLADIRNYRLQPDAWINAFCVREKFGLLYFAHNTNLRNPYRHLLVASAYKIRTDSEHVCEVTGKYGELRDVGGWLVVLSEAEFERAKKMGLRTHPRGDDSSLPQQRLGSATNL